MPTTDDPDSVLEEVAEEFIASLRSGQKPSIESYAARHPSLAGDIYDMLSSIELMERLSRNESDARKQANAGHVPMPAIEKLGDFDIVQEIGRGGMGVVYEAMDRTLQRRVALKVLNDSALATQKHVDRFRRESRLAAQLHHANIVSVFGVGEEGGKHFYAMQYVEGVSVQDILDGLQQISTTEGELSFDQSNSLDGLCVAAALNAGQFAEPRATHVDVKPDAMESNSTAPVVQVVEESQNRPKVLTTGSTAAFWRSVARIGIQVADALHYAHVNGILHRDIKPANLLFDTNGTVWVADFGLAKLAETDDLTKTGDVVGTLKYMAPEQLAGKADVRTDIYGLGLTLYELLTLQSVCDGETFKELFAQKQETAHTAPRKINPSIPRDLETIVQKALEWEPEKRYASSRELSEDLQRFLDDEPIRARRVQPTERAWRWCRRNRSVAALCTMVAILLVSLPVVLGWAYVRESRQNDRMEKTVDVVLNGFDELFSFYHDGNLATAAALTEAPGDDAARLAPAMLTKGTARVLEKMLVVYDRLAETNASSTSVGLAVESARARRRVGDLYQQLGQFESANDAYADATERYAKLTKRDTTFYIEVARVYQAIGAIHEHRQNVDLARTEYEKAIHALEQAPRSDASQFETAQTHYLLGKQPIMEGAPERGRNFPGGPGPFRHDPGHGPPPTDAAPKDPPFHDATYEETRMAHLESAIQQVDELLLKDANHAGYRFLLALCLREKERADPQENSSDADAIDLLKTLVEQFPTVPRYRYELCETYRNIGRNSPFPGNGERLERLQRARELGEQLVKEQRDAALYRLNLAHIYAHLGVAYSNIDNVKKAEEFTRLSIATHESITRDFPGLAALSYRLSTNDKTRLGRWLLQLRRYEELVELLQPLGDQLFEKLNSASEGKDDDLQSTRQALRDCQTLLLPAYEAAEDEEGYLVALAWLDSTDGPLLRPSAFGPPPPGPIGGNPTNRLAMALSHDTNGDGRLARDEVSPLMRQHWFRQADTDQDNYIDREELIAFLR